MRFYILLRGERFVSRQGEHGPSLKRWPTTFGFYTTRVVDAPDAERAVEQATTDVYQDVRLRSLSVEGTGVIVPEEVRRVSWLYRRFRAPRGFTFVAAESEAIQATK
jgi:hypothetical protein